MAKPIGKVRLEARGVEYEATIDSITARAADARSPWHGEDTLYVWLSFEHSEGKYPGSTLGFGVVLPVKDYKPYELLRLIKVKAEEEVEESLKKADLDHAYWTGKDARQKELDKAASQLADSLGKITKTTE